MRLVANVNSILCITLILKINHNQLVAHFMSLIYPIINPLRLWMMGMLFNAILFTIFMPLSIGGTDALSSNLGRPFLVQAVVDSARIIGLPSSKAAKAYAQRIQTPDPALKQITFNSDPVSDRTLFFRKYFANSGG